VTIEKPTGEQIEVPHWELDCGGEFETRAGGWLPESDPRVLRYLAGLRDKKEPERECALMNRYRESFSQNLSHVLQRNGYRA
jgi:hypothetical protein